MKKKQCKECRNEFELSNFVNKGTNKKTGRKQYSSRCRDCYKTYLKTWPSYKTYYFKGMRKLFPEKQIFVESVKVKCVVCGYDKCKAALDFHHTNQLTKEYTVSELMWQETATLEQLQAEIEKCVVLCCRCHREYHAGVIELLPVECETRSRSTQ